MAKKDLLQKMFDAHLHDLKSVALQDRSTILCPICLEEYSEDDLRNGNLTIGHVWPDYIRAKSKSKVASLQRVLVCKGCNCTAGSRGDKQMQLREKVKDGEKAGQLYGERKIQILKTPGKVPISLQGEVSMFERTPASARITFLSDARTQQWLRNNPREQERFLREIGQEKFTIYIGPPHELKSELSMAGWITSAYLFAFYTLGYRYILHPALDNVREYIWQS